MFYPKLAQTIAEIHQHTAILEDRKAVLQPLIDYIEKQMNRDTAIQLNFICTHNSRRSHLAQVWATVASAYYDIPNLVCYSGGTEETAVYPTILSTLINQGFHIEKLIDSVNPMYAIQFADHAEPIMAYSKVYDASRNPSSAFAAIMTCSQADTGCPYIPGAEIRIPITYEDPKIADHTPIEKEVYISRSIEIAIEMFYIFSKINKN